MIDLENITLKLISIAGNLKGLADRPDLNNEIVSDILTNLSLEILTISDLIKQK